MTLIAVFNDSRSTQLISDSLITKTILDDMASPRGQWLSTGVYLDENEQLRYKYDEGVLKIWAIQTNLAIGLAGSVWLATTLLELIVNHSRIEPFTSFNALAEYVERRALPSITPFHGSCELCGFVGEGESATKFVFSISDSGGLKKRSSRNPDEAYVIGSGSSEFINVFNRLPKSQLFGGQDPTMTFSIFAEHFYLSQFLGRRETITQKYTGGAISGLYYSNGGVDWHPSRSVVTFANMGGTGFDAEFVWLPIVYKTWYDRGNVFSSSMFEQSGHYCQRLTQYSNLLSETLVIDENTLTPDMRTFNAHQLSVILLPKGISNEYPAVVRVSGEFRAFDELLENDRMVGLRLNKDFFARLNERFFVADDCTVQMGAKRFPPLINALRRQLYSLDRERDPIRWIQKQEELAVRLTTYGGQTTNLDLLSEALSHFLDAYTTAKERNLDLLRDCVHNLRQFIHDTNSNLKHTEAAVIFQRNNEAYQKYLSDSGNAIEDSGGGG